MKKGASILVLLVTLGFNVFAQFPKAGLIGYWPFNGNANDFSGNNYHGVLWGPVGSIDRFGNPNNAYYFDGINDYIQIAHNSALNLSGSFSFSLWYKTENTLLSQRLIDKATVNTSDSWLIDHRPNNQVRLIVADSKVTKTISNPDFTKNNTWTHLVVTYDGSNVRFYKNGKLDSTIPQTGSTPANTNPVRIGANSLLYLDFFKGVMDDIAIWNRVLTVPEIEQLFSAKDYLSLSESSVVLSSKLDSSTVKVTSNLNWSVVSDKSWLSVSPTTGTGDATISLKSSMNTGASRTAQVIVYCNGVTSDTINITQSAAVATSKSDTLFFDNFNDNSISTKWTTEGNSVVESGGIFKLSTDVIDKSGFAYSLVLNVNNQNPIKIYRRAYVSYANNEVNHFFNFEFGKTASFIPQGGWSKGVVVSYTNYSYFNMYGLYIGGRWSTIDPKYVPGVISQPAVVPWAQWFDEVVTYDPKTGKATESINGKELASVTIDALSSEMKYARFYISSYGWWTGHTHQMDYLLITQEPVNSVVAVEEGKRSALTVLPNPVQDFLQVKGCEKRSILTILDMRGSIVLSRTIDADNVSVDVSALKRGVYLIKIESEEGTFFQKLIKK